MQEIQFSRTDSWERLDNEHQGAMSDRARLLALLFPSLTTHERQVAALISFDWSNVKIAEVFGHREESIERCRNRIRKRLNLPKYAKLYQHFLKAISDGEK